ncbi:MAG: M3 family oligoendopeptidase [Alphaproteobacteria bacterium]|nr:M3 family oligoendopeptidase [Alphaproteobacteria bacterium]
MTEAAALGPLPEWDLRDLYPGPESDAFRADLAAAKAEAETFAKAHKGRVEALAAADFGRAIRDYERQTERLGRLSSYAQLLHAGNVSDPAIGRFFQNTMEAINAVSSELLFFTLEINRLADDRLEAKLADAAAARYRPWLRDLRAFRPHQLADDLERILHEKEVAGRAAWVRLFDETMAALRFPIEGRALTAEQTLHLLSDKDEAKRRAAAKALGAVFGDNIRLFAMIANTLAKDKEIEDRWRKFPSPEASRHLSNQVEPEVVAALVKAVRDSYPKLSHRYYALKARWLGKERLDYWDRNAPLPEDDDRKIGWAEARRIVLDAYGAFSGELAGIGRRFFDSPWIDAPVRPGKAGGAFAHSTVPSVHPYLMLNYQGKARDVMTLAHELGHGVHQVLAAGQGALMADTPLTLAETASVFGEQLTFRALLEGERDPRRKRVMLAGKVEDMLNTVVRQVAFYEFESRLHAERRQGELTAERIGEIWLAVQTESLGPALRFEDEYRCYWAYIPHFVHSPFYVYAYAFGDCLVNALYGAYLDRPQGFEAKYLDMLRAGGTLRHRELLRPFGLDAADPGFWARGLGVIADFIDQLERG